MVRRVSFRNQRRNGDWLLLFHKHRRMKQTAIDWFEYQLKDNLGNIVINQNWQLLEDLIEQAKELERKQIIEAHGDKKRTKSNPGSCVTYAYTFTGEMYYNEIFKSE